MVRINEKIFYIGFVLKSLKVMKSFRQIKSSLPINQEYSPRAMEIVFIAFKANHSFVFVCYIKILFILLVIFNMSSCEALSNSKTSKSESSVC